MLEVTMITDSIFYEEITQKYYYESNCFVLLLKFCEYLLREDSLYCHVPNHESYAGQLVISDKFKSHLQLLGNRTRK